MESFRRADRACRGRQPRFFGGDKQVSTMARELARVAHHHSSIGGTVASDGLLCLFFLIPSCTSLLVIRASWAGEVGGSGSKACKIAFALAGTEPDLLRP